MRRLVSQEVDRTASAGQLRKPVEGDPPSAQASTIVVGLGTSATLRTTFRNEKGQPSVVGILVLAVGRTQAM